MSRPLKGIATDAAYSTKERLTRYRAVNLSTGEELFSEALGNQTVNIGEFLGIVAAIRYILENDFTPAIIYSEMKHITRYSIAITKLLLSRRIDFELSHRRWQ